MVDSISQCISELKQTPSPDLLKRLGALCKGKDKEKIYVSEVFEVQLLNLLYDQNVKIVIEAARLLRRITVTETVKNKFSSSIPKFVEILSTGNNIDLQIALMATLWNLSASDKNRPIFLANSIFQTILPFLNDVNELSSEAIGCLRNFTDDRDTAEQIPIEVVKKLVNLLPQLVRGSKMTINLLHIISNFADFGLFLEILGSRDVINHTVALFKPKQGILKVNEVANILEFWIALSQFENLTLCKVKDLTLPPVELSNEEAVSHCESLLEVLRNRLNPLKKVPSEILKKSEDYVVKLLESMNVETEIQEQDLHMKEEIGRGNFGNVYLAEYHTFPVAVKVLNTVVTSKSITKIFAELKLLRKLKHPNVIMLMGACLSSNNKIMIVTEYCQRGDLVNSIDEVRQIHLQWKLAHDTLVGLNWLQGHNITHRDLKLDNLLVTYDWVVKISDFGLAIETDDSAYWKKWGGNVKFSAPEILAVKYGDDPDAKYPYGEATDVYSFGLIWWQILTKVNPFSDRPTEYKSTEGLARWVLEGNRPKIPSNWPISVSNMIERCWSKNRSDRPTFREILSKWPELTLDMLCTDIVGREISSLLWKDADLQTRVSYSQFAETFHTVCNKGKASAGSKIALEKLARESIFDDSVSLGRWCYIVGWFGPLGKDPRQFFEKIREFERLPFVIGFVSDERSEELLMEEWNRTSDTKSKFHVRYSMEQIGEFYLSYVSDGSIGHAAIWNRPCGLTCLGKQFPDWKSLRREVANLIKLGKKFLAMKETTEESSSG